LGKKAVELNVFVKNKFLLTNCLQSKLIKGTNFVKAEKILINFCSN